MSFEFSCYNKKDISRLFCLLMGYDINNLKLKFHPSDLSADELNSLLNDLDQLQVPYTRERQDDSDNEELDDEDINTTEDVQDDYATNFMKLIIPYPEEDVTTDVVSKDIEDPEKLFLVRRVIGEAKLVRIIKNYRLGLTLDKKLVLTGNEEDVDQVIFKIINMNCEKSEYLTFDKAKCLKTTLYFRKLKDIYKTKIIIMYDRQIKSFQLAVCGEDIQAVKDCLIKVNEAIENIAVFLDLPSGLEIANEADEILKYFKERYRNKCQEIMGRRAEYQIGFSKNHKRNRYNFYFFSLCPKNDFQLMTEYLLKETKDICFLAALPKENRQVVLNMPKNCLDVKLHLSQSENSSCLLIGKAKHFKAHIQELIGMGGADDNINYYNLFIRRIQGVETEKFGEHESFIVDREDPSVYSFLIDQGWESVSQIFETVDKIARGIESPEGKSCSYSVISKEKSKGQEGSPEVVKEQPEEIVEKDQKEEEIKLISSEDDQEEVKVQNENVEIGLDLQPEIVSEKPTNEEEAEKLIPTEDEQQDSINENNIAFDEGAIENDLKVSEFAKSDNKPIEILSDLQPEIMHFSEVNVPESFFMIEGDNTEEYESIEEGNEFYKQLCEILKKDYPEAEVGDIVKLYNEENWKEYFTRRGNYAYGDVKEYIVMYESSEDPTEHIKENPKDVMNKLIGTFNPNRDDVYVQEDGRYLMLACVVLYSSQDLRGIIDYYPAFLIDFK